MRHIVRAIVALAIAALSLSTVPSLAGAARSSVSLPRILGGYVHPVLVTHAPGSGRAIFIVEQRGVIKRATFEGGAWQKLGTFLDLRSLVKAGGEQGLLGLAFHPDYEANGRFYVDYTRRGDRGARGDTVIAEYRRATDAQADPSSRRVVLTVDQPASNHNGGHLAFGPDGFLYIALGDGGGGGDTYRNGQDRGSLLAKILRIDPLDPDGSGPRHYRVPPSNPWVGRPGRDETWAWGLRNPWRFSFDRASGDLWIGDVGQGAREEVDRGRATASGRNAGRGVNYGWSRCEGSRRYPATGQACRFGKLPAFDYAHRRGRCSVTGGHVYRGPADAAWRGLYVAGDFCGGLIVLDGRGRVRWSRTTPHSISSFGEDEAGRLFAADIAAGSIHLVRFRGPRP
jgi:glucose/arabinose dehydrogenase